MSGLAGQDQEEVLGNWLPIMLLVASLAGFSGGVAVVTKNAVWVYPMAALWLCLSAATVKLQRRLFG